MKISIDFIATRSLVIRITAASSPMPLMILSAWILISAFCNKLFSSILLSLQLHPCISTFLVRRYSLLIE
ncbi:MAG: hypothetical protein ACTSRP_25145 [Candidatus Helarchaeota archaeon]